MWNTTKRVLNIFFVGLGVIFFLLILVALYLFIADPWNIRGLLGGEEATLSAADEAVNVAPVDRHPVLNEQQEQLLDRAGIDPATVPTELGEENMACFVELFGAERVDEVTAGANPTPLEIVRGQQCL